MAFTRLLHGGRLLDSWKEEAHRLLPELAEEIDEAENPYQLWIELRYNFARAYEQKPRDHALIRRIYHYSNWCVSQPESETAEDDLATCVAVCFYEHIPQSIAAREDMPRWFGLKSFQSMEQVFRYHITEQEYQELQLYFERNRHVFMDGWWNGDPFER